MSNRAFILVSWAMCAALCAAFWTLVFLVVT